MVGRMGILSLVIFIILILAPVLGKAATICERGGEEKWESLTLSQFEIWADKVPIKSGDTVYYHFTIKNNDLFPITLSQKRGVYLRLNGEEYHVALSGITIPAGKSLDVKSSFQVNGSGTWVANPGLCVAPPKKGDICHDFETSCSFEVFAECDYLCLTEKQAQDGNYIKLSDEICNYTISGIAALIKTPMYCYREVLTCPEGTQCLSVSDANSNGMHIYGESPMFCGYSDDYEEKYCYQPGMPDLAVSQVWPVESSPGVYSQLRAYVYNRGDFRAGNFSVAFFADGEYLGEVEVGELGEGGHTVASLPIARICDGEQDVVTAFADYSNEVAESDETNNRANATYTCSGGLIPNLEVLELNVNFEYCKVVDYSENPIIVEIRNSGNQTSPAAKGKLMIDGVVWKIFDIPELAAGETATIPLNVNLMCTGDNDELSVVIDPNDRIIESNENDNSADAIVHCIERGSNADLYITNFTHKVVTAYLPGRGEIPLYAGMVYTITNKGYGYACDSNTYLYVDDKLFTVDAVEPLAPGESRERTIPYGFNNCTDGQDTLRIVADATHAVHETNEANNERILNINCYDLPHVPKPDLVVEDVSWMGSDVKDLDVWVVIFNDGDAPSTSTSLWLTFRYPDGTVEGHRFAVPPIDPGHSYRLEWNNAWTPPWQHVIAKACVDEMDYVSEYNEENNCRIKAWTINGMSCSDGVRNRDEIGVDCGGPCPPCGYVSVRGRIVYEDGLSNFKPARFLKYKVVGDADLGVHMTNSRGEIWLTLPQNLAGKELQVKIGGHGMYDTGFNYAVKIAKDLDYCNEYVWFLSRTFRVPSRGILDLGDLKVGMRNDIDFTSYWKEHKHGFCGGSTHSLGGGSAYFNIADAILTARMYADAHRSDSDGIGKVAVQYPDADWSNFHPIWEEITLYKGNKGDHGFKDGTAIHEFGHYLQKRISSHDIYFGIDSSHTFCSDKDDTEFAWSEGFAEYFGTLIVAKNPHLDYPNEDYWKIESPPCGKSGDDMESTVAAVLWDLADDPTFPGSINESFDAVSGMDDIVFSIFDRELDNSWEESWDAPDLCEFLHEGIQGSRLSLSSSTKAKIEDIFDHYNACD
ncbi:MAG: hypothetical protein H0Z28_08110 [Archaeoglobus sp.]|nr:hypothetical protein [Archaeoglobus sp.]